MIGPALLATLPGPKLSGFQNLAAAFFVVITAWFVLERVFSNLNASNAGVLGVWLQRWRRSGKRSRTAMTTGLAVFMIGTLTLTLWLRSGRAGDDLQGLIGLFALLAGAGQLIHGVRLARRSELV